MSKRVGLADRDYMRDLQRAEAPAPPRSKGAPATILLAALVGAGVSFVLHLLGVGFPVEIPR